MGIKTSLTCILLHIFNGRVAVAQLVEALFGDQRVAGSSPATDQNMEVEQGTETPWVPDMAAHCS